VLKHAGLSPGPGSAARHEPMGTFRAESNSNSHSHSHSHSHSGTCYGSPVASAARPHTTTLSEQSCSTKRGGLLALGSESPFIFRRVAEESGGERRACLSAGMREFAPADGF
jgi:hypothetical protein